MRTTTFSPCRKYRYTLWREWDMMNDSYAMFIGLNPSTADETQDDPTIRRCIDYAKRWGYGALCMTNIFAFRSTDPKVMLEIAIDPIGMMNDAHILTHAEDAGVIVAAWGKHGEHMNRGQAMVKLIPNLTCLKLNQDGSPSHPLYLKATLTPIPYPIV